MTIEDKEIIKSENEKTEENKEEEVVEVKEEEISEPEKNLVTFKSGELDKPKEQIQKLDVTKIEKGSLAEIERLAMHIFNARYFTDIKAASRAVVKMMAGKELGIPPIRSMTGVYIVNGNAALEAADICGLIKKSGKYNYRVIEKTDVRCEVEAWEKSEFTDNKWQKLNPNIDWDLARLKKAGLTKETHQKYTRSMLFNRAITELARTHFADLFAGPIYTPDELDPSIKPGEN